MTLGRPVCPQRPSLRQRQRRSSVRSSVSRPCISLLATLSFCPLVLDTCDPAYVTLGGGELTSTGPVVLVVSVIRLTPARLPPGRCQTAAVCLRPDRRNVTLIRIQPAQRHIATVPPANCVT